MSFWAPRCRCGFHRKDIIEEGGTSEVKGTCKDRVRLEISPLLAVEAAGGSLQMPGLSSVTTYVFFQL